jgi:putative addiction module component (TIGR02574 family)
MSVQDIRDEALKLPPQEREWLAQELWNSVETDCDPGLLAELDRRWEEIVTGKVKTISLEETLRRARIEVESVRAERSNTSRS